MGAWRLQAEEGAGLMAAGGDFQTICRPTERYRTLAIRVSLGSPWKPPRECVSTVGCSGTGRMVALTQLSSCSSRYEVKGKRQFCPQYSQEKTVKKGGRYSFGQRRTAGCSRGIHPECWPVVRLSLRLCAPESRQSLQFNSFHLV